MKRFGKVFSKDEIAQTKTFRGLTMLKDIMTKRTKQIMDDFLLENLINDGFVFDYKIDIDEEVSPDKLLDIIAKHVAKVKERRFNNDYKIHLFINPSVNDKVSFITNINGVEVNNSTELVAEVNAEYSQKAPEDTLRVLFLDKAYVDNLIKNSTELKHKLEMMNKTLYAT